MTARFPQFPPLIGEAPATAHALARPLRRPRRVDPGRRRRAAPRRARDGAPVDARGRPLRRRRPRLPLRRAARVRAGRRQRRLGAHARVVRAPPSGLRALGRGRAGLKQMLLARPFRDRTHHWAGSPSGARRPVAGPVERAWTGPASRRRADRHGAAGRPRHDRPRARRGQRGAEPVEPMGAAGVTAPSGSSA